MESMWAIPGREVKRVITLWDADHLNRLWIVPAKGHPGWNYVHGVFEDGWREIGITEWLRERGREVQSTPFYVGINADRHYYRCLDHACTNGAAMELRLRWDCGVIHPEVAPYPWDGRFLP